ncbi:MAG TPA: glycosyltransferase [Prolixibacteraceae bacterium]|nr:glycosyltransferase [Prolixibacteraceae bacterium]
MIENRDIVVVGIQAWDIEIGSNCKNIAEEFAKNNRVLYVNSPLDRISMYRHQNLEKIRKRTAIVKTGKPQLIDISPNLWNLYPATLIESLNWIGSPRLFDWLNKINNRRFAKQIAWAIEQLGFKNFIIFNDSDMFRSFYLKELLKPETYIYYTRDNLIAVDYWKKQGVRIEAQHMKKADLVVANSTYLAALARKHNSNSFYVGQGCDVSLFDTNLATTVPADIETIPKPIIGYIGALLSLRLDVQVLEYIAESRPDWSIVLVGPEDDTFKASKLHQLKNVHFLGNKNGNELPSYLNRFDVAINPQVLNPVTIGNYPRKIDEYLAMGKPTVATKTEAMSVFADYTYLAENKEEYVTFIEKALQEDNDLIRLKRKEFARQHTWTNNVREISRAVEATKSPQYKTSE